MTPARPGLDLADMATAAAARGVCYDVFRKGWRGYVRTLGFPAPVSMTRPYMWRPEALTAWQLRREAENLARLQAVGATEPGAAANENDTGRRAPPAVRRDDRDRLAVLSFMTGG